MRTHGAVVGRRFRSVTKLTTKVRIGRGYLWGSFLIAAAALKTRTRNGYNAQGVNLNYPGGTFDHWTAISADCGSVGEGPYWLTIHSEFEYHGGRS